MVNFIFVGYLGAIATVALEFIMYRGIVGNYFYFQSWQIIFIYLACIGLVQLGRKLLYRATSIPPSLTAFVNSATFDIPSQLSTTNNRVIFPLSLILATLLFGTEAYTHSNFLFSTLGINHFALSELLIMSFGLLTITISRKTLKNYWPVLLFSGFLISCFFLFNYHHELFLSMSSNMGGADDDNFMEWLQVAVLGIGALISGWLAYFSRKSLLLTSLYIGAAIVFIVLIGEEISWGERLFDLPLQPNSQNYQNELNLHNQPFLNELSGLLYIFAFFYALGSWSVYALVEQKKKLSRRAQEIWQFFCFRGNEIIFFIPTLIFNPYSDRTMIKGYPPLLDIYHNAGLTPEFFKTLHFLVYWRETFEVLFYLGLTIHFIQILMIQIHKDNKGLKA